MRTVFFVLLGIFLAAGLIGCNISKPYVTTKDRVDQDLAVGNKGYLKGTPPPEKDRETPKRPFIAIDIDLPQIKGKPTEPTRIAEADSPFRPAAKVLETVTSPRPSESDEAIK